MTKSGVAELIARGMLTFLVPFGEVGVLVGVYVVTAVLGSMMLNKAAIALLFPVVLTIALDTGMDPIGLILCMTFAAAANFISPVGFQTNLMVYGPGGYRIVDFVKVGLPLNVLLIVAATLLIPMMWPFY